MNIEKIQAFAAQGKYTLTKHAEREREKDRILIWELETALTTCRLVEDYPEDPRGASALVLGFCGAKPIHVVCALKTDPDDILLITVYNPAARPEKWAENYSKRR